MRQLSAKTRYLLEALLPYSKANLELTFKPSTFFKEMDKKGGHRQAYRTAYYRAIQKGLIKIDDSGHPRLTEKGRHRARIYTPSKLAKEAYLVLVFDVPEVDRIKRTHLRTLLRELSFRKVQQSVWISKYDHREYLAAEIKEYNLENNVIIYEAAKLNI